MEKRLIGVLSAALVGALLVIAFLAGRLSVKPDVVNAPGVQAAQSETASKQQPAAVLPVPVQISAPPDNRQPHPETPVARPVQMPVQIPLQDPHHAETPQTSGTVPDPAVVAYFARIDAIQVEGNGDPTAFAQSMVGGIEQGDSSQMDKLIGEAKQALSKIREVRPPVSCVEYHRRLIEALNESVGGLERFRNTIEKHDMNSVASVATELEGTQQKINDLESLRKHLLDH